MAKSISLRLPLLLSQFLYQTKKLNLQGIGSFTLDPAVVIPDGTDKDLHAIASGIQFKYAAIQTPDDELIEFIKIHTGKMKPLASADLDFYLTTGTQLLNIGKPFYLEGIGTLIKNKEGKLDFTPGEYSTLKLEDPDNDKRDQAEKRRTLTESSHRANPPQSNKMRQAILLVAIIGGLIIIGWGGYTLYKKNSVPEPAETIVPVKTDTISNLKTDSQALATNQAGTVVSKRPDSLAHAPIAAAVSPAIGNTPYKFIVLQTANKARALRRYNQLVSFDLNIKMETKDSTWFKLYFPITATARDTTHIKDSLATFYASKVTIEH